jgi:phenylacetate-CoA ligase
MRDTLRSLLRRLPPPARSAAVTLGGMYVRRRRASGDHAGRVVDALARDAWPADRWRAWSDERLAELLHHAATRVPYYRAHWERRRRVGDRTSWDRLENWPLLEKDELRAGARQFLADGADPRRMQRLPTGGRSGKPLTVWRSRATAAELEALADVRARGWHGIPPGTPWAHIGGDLIVPARQRRPPFWIWNGALRRLAMSTYHLAPDLIPHYLDALAQYRVGCVAGHPAALAALGEEVLRLGRTDLTLLAAFTGGPLPEEQRRVIAAAFRCPVVDSWGMTELAAHASRCPDGALHLWPDVGTVEVLGPGLTPVAPGEAGELVCTGLLNRDMPLIRYRVGDNGRLAPEDTRCTCGRALPLLASVDVRRADTLLTPDGRQICSLSPVFYGLPVRESQVVQESPDCLVVRVAPGVGYSAVTGRLIVARLASRVGGVDIRVETVACVARAAGPAPVVCHLSAEQRDALLRRARAVH